MIAQRQREEDVPRQNDLPRRPNKSQNKASSSKPNGVGTGNGKIVNNGASYCRVNSDKLNRDGHSTSEKWNQRRQQKGPGLLALWQERSRDR